MKRPEIEDAAGKVLSCVKKIDETLMLPLGESAGYILAEDIRAGMDQPPFDRSPLDGYALIAEDTKGVSVDKPVRLKVIDRIMAGTVSEKTVVPGTAVRLMTGAPIPYGADCVVRQEDTDMGRETVSVCTPMEPHDNICDAGEDFQKGDLLAAEGERLDYLSIAALAGAGVSHVKVYRRLRAAVLTTGDELCEPGEKLLPGKIYNSNLAMINARLKEWNIEIVCCRSAGDDPDTVKRQIEDIYDRADLIMTTGGVSVGEKDIMHDVVDLLGAGKLFGGVAVKPGAPTFAAIYRGKPLICLTGNPYGVLVNLELLAGAVMAGMSRDASVGPQPGEATAANDYRKTGGIRRLVRASFRNGEVRIPEKGQKSGVISSMRGCNCLADIGPECEGVHKGDMLRIWHLKK
ncbi:MAG: molybdopterin molybdotransferase MoeA [Lachnospiraceae bacterium]|nr:molybdopterin molybdotransferase MoeA [Lachnospiraceae bacterium]